MYEPKQFKLEPAGLSRILGEVEAKIMETLWGCGCATVREMCGRLGNKITFNAVMTIMNRLIKKGLLQKKSTQSGFCYMPTCARQEFFDSVTNKVIKSLISDPTVFSLAAFVQTLGEDPKILDQIRKLLKK